MLLCSSLAGLATMPQGASDVVANVIGSNIELGLGTNPEVPGSGVCGSGYIPCLLSCFSMRSASWVTHSTTAAVSNNSGKSMISS